MAYFKPDQKRNNSKKKIRQTIRPELDVQGIVRRNEQFLDTLYALRPHLLKDDESLQLIDKIIGGLEKIQPNVTSSESHDKNIASAIARLINNIQGDAELKPYVDALKKIGGELVLSRTKPRSIKEVLARNYLGLQPQDVRDKGVMKSFGDDAVQNLRAIFGGKGKEDTFKKTMGDQKAIQGIAKKREKRQEDEDKKVEDEANKKEQSHEEAIREDKERDRQKQRNRDKDAVHEEALEEEKNRGDAMKQGVATVGDSIAERDAIHAQAIERENDIEEATLTARENQSKREEQKKENQDTQDQKEKDEIEAASDDGVTAEILEEVKAIHEILEKGGIAVAGEGTGTGKGKTKGKAAEKPSDDETPLSRDDAINKMVNEFKISREKAEEAYDKQIKKEEESLVAEDKKEAELEAHAEDRERSMRRGAEERLQKEQQEAQVEELENAHAEALDMEEGSNKGRVHSTAIAQDRANETDRYRSMDKEQAHGEANAWQVQRTSGRIDDKDLAQDVANSMDTKREAQIAEKTKSHEEALKINEGRKLDKESAEKEARLTERWRNLPKDAAHEEALADEAKLNPAPVAATVEAPKPTELPDEPEDPEKKGKGGSWLGGAFKKAGGAIAKAGSGVAAGVAVGGAALAGGIYAWNKYSDAGKTTRDRAAEDKKLGTVGYETAQKRGYNSTKEMQAANRDRTQRKTVGSIGQMEPHTPHTTYTPRAHRRGSAMASGGASGGVTGMVMGTEKGGIDESITEKPTPSAPSSQIIYAPSAPVAQQPQRQERQSVFIRPVHPSFMRYQEKRLSRILFPQNTV